MTDDGRYYEYTYDAFGRITQVDDVTGTPVTVAEYRYNGLFQRTVTKTDRDGSSGLSGEDEYFQVYDDRWRVIEIWRKDASLGLDDYPKEVTVYHAAGMGGSSSPLDSVIARYRSDEGSTSGTPHDDWSEDATGTMDKRSTYFQNWRGDMVVVRGHGTTERIDSTPYGIPTGYVGTDQNRDGSVSGLDVSQFSVNAGAGNPMADMNFDGSIDGADGTAFSAEVSLTIGTVGGAHVLSPWADNHIGYAGYRLTDQTQTTVWHVRFREFVPELGVWTRRDPIGYLGGPNLAEYVLSMPLAYWDESGLACPPCGCRCGGGGDNGGGGVKTPTRAAYWIEPDKDKNKENTEKQKEEDDYHAKRGAYYQYTLICTDANGRSTTRVRSGWTHDIVGLMNSIAASGCCVKKFQMSTHHVPGKGVYADPTSPCSDSTFAASLPLCSGARVDLNMCNSCDLAKMICKNNPGIDAKIECTDGQNNHVPIDWWIWPWDGITVPTDNGGTTKTIDCSDVNAS